MPISGWQPAAAQNSSVSGLDPGFARMLSARPMPLLTLRGFAVRKDAEYQAYAHQWFASKQPA